MVVDSRTTDSRSARASLFRAIDPRSRAPMPDQHGPLAQLPASDESGGSDDNSVQLRLARRVSECSDRSLAPPTTQQIDPVILRRLQLALCGPRCIPDRVWASSFALMGLCAAVLILGALPMVERSPAWTRLTWAGAITFVVLSMAATECTVSMARMVRAGQQVELHTLLVPPGEDTVAGSPATGFLVGLLRAEVSPGGVQRTNVIMRHAAMQAFTMACLAASLIAGMGVGLVLYGDTNPTVAMTFGLAMAPPVWGVLFGWILFVHVPCTIVCDLVHQSTQQVSRLAWCSYGTSDFDIVMASVQDAHEKSVRLSALLGPTLLTNMGICFGLMALWLAIASGSQVELPRDIWMLVVMCDEHFIYVISLLAFTQSCMPIYAGGKVTAACDGLVTAIYSLQCRRHSWSSSAGALVTGSGVARNSMPCSDDLVRIKGIGRYALELNRGQAFGFTFRRNRVTTSLLNWVLVRGIIWMTLSFSIITYRRAEEREANLSNSTASGSAGGGGSEGRWWRMVVLDGMDQALSWLLLLLVAGLAMGVMLSSASFCRWSRSESMRRFGEGSAEPASYCGAPVN